MIDADASGITAPARDDGQGLEASAWVALTESSALVSISLPSAEWTTLNHHSPPPADLLTLLQHFNI